MSFPAGTEMFQFPAFALLTLWIQAKSTWVRHQSTAVETAPVGTASDR
jgi:hypothetical protein